MGRQFNPKILGATIIGFALVAGAYVVTNFGEPSKKFQVASVQNAVHQPRVAITITDDDNNGIEDWRDNLITVESTVPPPIDILDYTSPTTLTGKTGVSFIGDVIESKIYSPLSPSPEEVIDKTVRSLQKVAEYKLHGIGDIDIMEEWDDRDIVNYANTFANSIYLNDTVDTDFELDIISDVMRNGKGERAAELEVISNIYYHTKEDALKIPVPRIFVKEHIDLINTINALSEDVAGMAQTTEDPLLSLVHIRRYEEDVEGLATALQNMYAVFEEYGGLFKADDPALFFVQFSPDYQL